MNLEAVPIAFETLFTYHSIIQSALCGWGFARTTEGTLQLVLRVHSGQWANEASELHRVYVDSIPGRPYMYRLFTTLKVDRNPYLNA